MPRTRQGCTKIKQFLPYGQSKNATVVRILFANSFVHFRRELQLGCWNWFYVDIDRNVDCL